ncbi:Transmembrane protein [Mucuna pruriens]|uniref:Transmembrane protein n=1 Tax=Mucuna pruriens TaxID=157652 RepID=A0A371IA69_MUCPR|nr:Transmembrane protein [Mucuna pruriens]
MNQMSSGIVCGGNIGTNYMVPLSSKFASLSLNTFKSKGLVLDYWAPSICIQKIGRRRRHGIVASSNVASTSTWDDWKPLQAPSTPSLSDILWPSAGAFTAMAILGKVDQLLAPKGLSIAFAPFGAVSAILFATPTAPSARKYNMFMAHVGCAAIGVLALTVFGPGWLSRSVSIAASVAYMICTNSVHPPAASMPLLFIDGAKFHHLNFWYAVYPGAAACILLSLVQEVVVYLKNNFKF